MKYLLLFLNVLFCSNLFAQNLVSNPSFEIYKDCPKEISFFHRNVIDWRIPNNGSTDYFNDCSIKAGFVNNFGSQRPKSGLGYAGFYLYVKKSYREYITGKLIKPLEKGKTYKIRFYVNLSERSAFAIKTFGVVFHANKPRILLDAKPIVEETLLKTNSALSFISIESKDFLKNVHEWEILEAEYVAKGNESFFTIGNFVSNKKTRKLKVNNPKGPNDAYYYIDDISIEPIQKEEPTVIILDSIKQQDNIVLKNKVYRFNNVLFDFDKAELLDVSIKELNVLLKYLKNNSGLSIEIYGHTDNRGLDKRNKELSKQRAKAVADYLISQGLNPAIIRFYGFGSSKPISTNETEKGQKLNRRVEFKLIEN